MRTSTYTGLTLFEFGTILGISPFELAQIGTGLPQVNHQQCEHTFYQYSWQQDFLSREEVANAIQRAEEAIAEQLTYWGTPRYFVNEDILYPRPHERYLYGGGGNVRNQWKTVNTKWGKVQSGGILARTSILAGAVVAFTDTDNDTIMDTFTITAPTTLTDVTQIGVYYNSVDRLGAVIDETWRIRPINVSISAGVVTIKGHVTQIVRPILEVNTDPQNLDATLTTIYAQTLDIYQTTTDTTTTTTNPNQGVALWETTPCDDPPCSSEYVPVCVGPRNAELGNLWVDYTLNNTQCAPQAREPDRVSLNYLAGESLVNGKCNPTIADITARLAAAWLPVGKCGCDRSNRILDYWRSYPTTSDNKRPLTPEEINNNPFGVERGALYAWARVRNLALGRGVIVQ